MEDPFSVHAKVIVVTGATGTLAGACARSLVAGGASVWFVSRTAEAVERAAAACQGLGGEAFGHAGDVTDQGGMLALREAVLERHGRVDGLVNGAGGNRPGAVVPPDASLFDLSLADYRAVIALNLEGTLIPSLVLGEAMAERGAGAIVNFSSMAAAAPLTRVPGYSNAKAGVENLTRWLAVEMARRHGEGVRVNAVAPGFFLGDQNRALLLDGEGRPTERGEAILRNTPLGRFGEADEVAGAVRFLLSDAARFITGTVIPVDGGFLAFSGV